MVVDGCDDVVLLLEDCAPLPGGSCDPDTGCTCGPGYFPEPDCDQCRVYVNQTTGDDGNDGWSWDTALATVTAGLELAADDGCAIWVAEGTYFPTSGVDRTSTFLLREGVELYGGFTGTETRLEDRDYETHVTTLSGHIGGEWDYSDNSYHVVVGADDAVIDGFVITGGNANGVGAAGSGGGMRNHRVSPTVSNCSFLENSAERYGGGIYSFSSAATLTNCSFERNTANSDGGGIFNDGDVELTLTIGGCTFSRNNAVAEGGAIHAVDVPLVVTDSTFEGNSATSGGAIFVSNDHAALTRCSFSRNFAGVAGGALYSVGSDSTVTNCTFVENSARNGGGWYDRDASIATNCAFVDNAATNDGGGFYNRSASPVMVNCTFEGNTADTRGGGMYNYGGSAQVANSIFWNNSGTGSVLVGQIYSTGSASTSVTYTDTQGGVHAGEGNINEPPAFLLDSVMLSAGSPCIDVGNNAALPPDSADLDGDDDVAEPVPYDLYGNTRVTLGTVDMGVHEVGAPDVD